jgi:hypothetical protein
LRYGNTQETQLSEYLFVKHYFIICSRVMSEREETPPAMEEKQPPEPVDDTKTEKPISDSGMDRMARFKALQARAVRVVIFLFVKHELTWQ